MHDTSGFFPYQISSVGCDYVTAFGHKGADSLALENLVDLLVSLERSSGLEIKPSSRLGFDGWCGEHWFFGRRVDGNLLTASSTCAAFAAKDIITAASNVSRIDFQYTIDTPGLQGSIAQYHYRELESRAQRRGKPGGYSLTITRPHGDTLTLNRRSSDRFGRIYDKASESKLGSPGGAWRYEVELKRKVALTAARGYVASPTVGVYVCKQVSSFFTSKGVEPLIARAGEDQTDLPAVVHTTNDTSRWIANCLGPFMRKRINQRGLEFVLAELKINYPADHSGDPNYA